MFKKSFWGGSKEVEVIKKIKKHISILCSTCQTFKNALETEDEELIFMVFDLEREADIVRREIIAHIYEGAFLPFLRPNLCQFVEIVDEAIDEVEDAAQRCILGLNLEGIKEECIKIASLNLEACEMLSLSFEAFCQGEDLREKNLAIRIYEKRIDEIKIDLIKRLIKTKQIGNFWEGKILSDFLEALVNVSDVIEDASDHLQIINISVR